MKYVLTRLGKYDDHRVVLINSFAPEGGRYGRGAILPHSGGKTGKDMVAEQFVTLRLLNPAGGDPEPELGCDEPDKLIPWAWEFLTWGIPEDWLWLEELGAELRSAGIKLPKIIPGLRANILMGSFVSPAAQQGVGVGAKAAVGIGEIFIGPPR